MEQVKMEDRKWCVYMHTNKINNKVYVGITSRSPEDRWGYNGNNYTKDKQPVFYNAIDKYGWENFEHIIFAEGLTEYEAKRIEVILIALYKTNCRRYKNPELGYNMTDGGEGTSGRICTDETKRKISERAKGRVFSEELKQKFSVIFSEEGNPFYGKHHTEETKKILSEARSIPVIQLGLSGEYIAEFPSGKEASLATNIDATTINDCCIGKPHCKSGGGYLWIYKKDYNPDVKMSYQTENLTAVIQLNSNGDFIAEYTSIKEASQITGAHDTGIVACCRGRYKTSGGFKWMYKKDWEEMQGAV